MRGYRKADDWKLQRLKKEFYKTSHPKNLLKIGDKSKEDDLEKNSYESSKKYLEWAEHAEKEKGMKFD